MESPPTYSARSSEALLLSEDSGLLLTSGHSGSLSSSSSCLVQMEFQESDLDDNNLSESSLDDGMCGENFNTLKKGPNGCWTDCNSTTTIHSDSKQNPAIDPIDPPLEFQDSRPPTPAENKYYEKYALQFVNTLIEEALIITSKSTWSIECSELCHPSIKQTKNQTLYSRHGPRLCWTPELLSYNNNSPCPSRSSLSSSRLSSSHNSLSVIGANKVDDSSFITSAMSHDILNEISDLYNVPFDSDIYALPVDMVHPANRLRQIRPQPRYHRKRRRHNNLELCRGIASSSTGATIPTTTTNSTSECVEQSSKRHSVPGPSSTGRIDCNSTEPIHMTLHEVRQYLHNLYSGTTSDETKNRTIEHNNNNINSNKKPKKNTFSINIKNKKTKETCESKLETNNNNHHTNNNNNHSSNKKSFSSHLKQTLCNLFRIRKVCSSNDVMVEDVETKAPFLTRALPPLPQNELLDTSSALSRVHSLEEPVLIENDEIPNQLQPTEQEQLQQTEEEPSSMDFASSIEKVKDYGWYWGPISSEAAERILSNEPDGSFIVRDSSDDHYIFSLTFKLNSCIRHVRIEHDQGNFSFGSCTKFKSHTIVEFIENAVEHSRSGRYLFFLHRRPVLGPMRVQLLHPVSRFKQVQSLQHMCRFVILKLVRRDLISSLPLPRRLLDYLSTPHYYSEQLSDETIGTYSTNTTTLPTNNSNNLFNSSSFNLVDQTDS